MQVERTYWVQVWVRNSFLTRPFPFLEIISLHLVYLWLILLQVSWKHLHPLLELAELALRRCLLPLLEVVILGLLELNLLLDQLLKV